MTCPKGGCPISCASPAASTIRIQVDLPCGLWETQEKPLGYSPSDLANLETMRQSVMQKVLFINRGNLRHPSKRRNSFE